MSSERLRKGEIISNAPMRENNNDRPTNIDTGEHIECHHLCQTLLNGPPKLWSKRRWMRRLFYQAPLRHAWFKSPTAENRGLPNGIFSRIGRHRCRSTASQCKNGGYLDFTEAIEFSNDLIAVRDAHCALAELVDDLPTGASVVSGVDAPPTGRGRGFSGRAGRVEVELPGCRGDVRLVSRQRPPAGMPDLVAQRERC